MKPKKAPQVSDTVWAQGLDRLIRACGWKSEESGKQFGLHPRKLNNIRYHGVRPKKATQFMLQLRKLEAVYADDLRALESGAVEFRNGERIDWRIKGKGKFGRPEDLRALGQVVSTNEVAGLSLWAAAPSPRSTRSTFIGRGVDADRYTEDRFGRPAAESGRLGDSVEGVS